MEKSWQFSDSELINSIKSNTNINSAIQFIYQEHFVPLSSLITYNSGSSEDAQDIFQEVVVGFIECIRNDKFRGEASIKTFLHAMMRNTWLNELKKRGRSDKRDKIFEAGREQQDNTLNAVIENRESKQQLLAVFDQLADGCKKILLLFYYENLPMKEILEQTDYENEQVVRNKKSKCLKELTGFIKNNTIIVETLKRNKT